MRPGEIVPFGRTQSIAVVGAGIVGVACARALARDGASVVLIERHGAAGRETSSRHSGVVHAGLYYAPGSLKARLCVEGRDRLARYCEANDVPFRRTGKLVVATGASEVPALEALHLCAHENGATETRILDGAELRRREPSLRAAAAIESPATAIVDGHELLRRMLVDANAAGCDVAFGQRVVAIERVGERWRVIAETADRTTASLEVDLVVNAAGLESDRVASLFGIDVDAHELRLSLYAGAYFALSSDAPRTTCPLVYPLPTAAGLGIHLTADLGGQRLAGPDARAIDAVAYDVDPALAAPFAASVARYLPGVEARHLVPAYAGVRPKRWRSNGTFGDFVIANGDAFGAPRSIHLVGIESPGLTASLAIGEHVLSLARGLVGLNDSPP